MITRVSVVIWPEAGKVKLGWGNLMPNQMISAHTGINTIMMKWQPLAIGNFVNPNMPTLVYFQDWGTAATLHEVEELITERVICVVQPELRAHS